jgi:hypothetical protein
MVTLLILQQQKVGDSLNDTQLAGWRRLNFVQLTLEAPAQSW